MKLDLQNLDEKSLKSDSKEPYNILWAIRGIIKKQKELTADPENERTKVELEEQLVQQLWLLVDNPLFVISKVVLSSVKDIFNAVCEKIEAWKDLNVEDLVKYLQIASVLTSNNLSQEKVDNSKVYFPYFDDKFQCLLDIIQSSQDYRAIVYAYEIQQTIGSNHKRGQASGQNKNGESLIQSDLTFEIDIESQGLNERQTSKTVVIPWRQIQDESLKASDVANDIAQKEGKDTDQFKSKLEAKIIWQKFIQNEERLHQASLMMLNALAIAYLYKSETRHTEYISYIKEHFLSEAMQLLSESGNKVLLIRLLQTMYKLIQRDQAQLISLDPLIKANTQNAQDGEDVKPFIIKLLEDICSTRVEEDGLSLVKVVNTQIVNAQVAKSSYFQFALLNYANMVIRVIQAIHNRGLLSYQEFANRTIETLIKIIEDCPQHNQVYAFNPKITLLACLILKFTIRPRNEEQYQIIKKFEAKIIYESQKLDQEYKNCNDEEDLNVDVDQKEKQSIIKNLVLILNELISRDQQNIGVSRRIQETQIINNLGNVLQYNNEEQGVYIDDFLPRYIMLIGSICSDNPAVTPTLIKNGIFQQILTSLNQRIPYSNDSIEALIFSINQMSLHEEGQKLVQESGIFKTLLNKVTDEKFCNSLIGTSDQMGIRMHLSNLFDRNPLFKETAKESLQQYLKEMEAYAIDMTRRYFTIIRENGKKNKEKSDEIQQQIKKSIEYNKMQGIITMIVIMANMSNDRQQQQSRYTQDIFNAEIFKTVLDIFEIISQNPALSDLALQMQKALKSLIEYVTFVGNVTLFVERFNEHTIRLQQILPVPLYQLGEFDFQNKEPIKENVGSIDQYDPKDIDTYLTKGERLLVQISLIMSYAKTSQYLHSATQYHIMQNQLIHKIGKTIYYLIRVIQKIKSNVLRNSYEQLKTDILSEEQKKFGQILNLQWDILQKLTPEEKKENNQLVKEFFSNWILEKFNELLPPELKLREQVFNEFILRMSNFSFHQMRHLHQREALEKNLLFIGKLMYKTTKQLSKDKLDKIVVDTSSADFIKELYSINVCINEILTATNKGLIDGASFYSFYKNWGLNNVIECFNWLSNITIEDNQPALFVNIYDDTCRQMKEFFLQMINSRNTENHMNSILSVNMGTDFDSPKHLYQNVYYTLCSELLPLKGEEKFNPVIRIYNSRNTYLLDVILLLLQQASKSFQICQMLKESQSNRNDREGRRGRNQADPVHVQSLLDMGMGFSRDRIIQALLQAQNNIDIAMNLLLEWQAQENFGIEDAPDQNLDDGLSSEESVHQDFSALDDKPQVEVKPKKKKIQKIKEGDYEEIIKKVQQEGFNWMIETQKKDDIQTSKFKDYFSTIMLNEKNNQTMKQMFAQIDEVFKRNADNLLNNLKNFSPEEQKEGDQIMEDEESKKKNQKDCIKALQKVSSDLSIYQKLISNNKVYLKESIKSDIFSKSLRCVHAFVNLFQKQSSFALISETQDLNQNIQRTLNDFLFLLFTKVQLMLLQMNQYALQKTHLETCQKKIQYFRSKLTSKLLFDYCLKILNIALEQYEKEKLQQVKQSNSFKKQILMTVCALALRVLMDPDLDKSIKEEGISSLFKTIISLRKYVFFSHDILNSLAVMSFENESLLSQSAEKLTQRALWLKYEFEVQKDTSQQEQGHLASKNGMNDFLKYFSTLSQKNPEVFKKVLTEQCELKSIKKLGIVSQDQAVIRLKDTVFNELKQKIQKDRGTLKQLQRQIDFQNDKNLKDQSKKTKKIMQTQISDNQKNLFQSLISGIADQTQEVNDDINKYLNLAVQKQKYVIPKSEVVQTTQVDKNIFETLFKISQAYPAYTVLFLQSQPQPKKSFQNWFIKDFLVTKMLQQQEVARNINNNQEQSQQQQQDKQVEVSYEITPNLKPIDLFVVKALNYLTGYNHLMSLNDQIVKHEIRTKFVLEALNILQKTLKDKQLHKLKQKCLILASLFVINSLVNQQSFAATKQQSISQDNFVNSIRACVLRDASMKESNLSNSFIKITNDLLGEIIDVTLPSNSDIVSKCITIMRVFSEFIQNEKKKEDKEKEKASRDKSIELVRPGEAIVNDQNNNNNNDVIMNQENVVNQQQQPVDQFMANEENMNENEDMEMDQQQQENIIDQNENGDDSIHDDDDEGQDEEDEIDEDDENDVVEDVDDEEEEGLFEDNDDDDDMEDEIQLQRQEGDHDLFEDEEDIDEDEEELILQDRFDPVDRRGNAGGRQADIINFNERDVVNNRFGGNYRRYQQDQRRNDFTEEEEEVSRILYNMRIPQDPAPRAAPMPGDRYNFAAPHGANDQAQKKGLVEQMFDGLQLSTDKELFEIVISQKIELDNEAKGSLRELKKQIVDEFQGGIRINVHNGARADEFDDIIQDFEFVLGGDRIQDRIVNLQALLRNNPALNNPLANPFLDPMFIRPLPNLHNQGMDWNALNPPIYPPQRQENIDYGAYSNSLRIQTQQAQANQSEGLGAQLIEGMQIEVEEEKKPEEKPQLQPKKPGELTNEQLLQDFFSLEKKEIEDERIRVQQMSRQLNEEVMRNSQAINQIVQQQRQQNNEGGDGAQIQPEVISPSNFIAIQQNSQQQPQPIIQPFDAEIEEHKEQQQEQPLSQNEEQKQQNNEANQQQQNINPPAQSSNRTFGYDNEVLLANGIDPAILAELPEELRAELLSGMEFQLQGNQ